MATPPEDYSWSPLFEAMEAPSEPQTSALPPITNEATVPLPEVLQVTCEAVEGKVPTIAPHRKTEALADTFWRLQEVRAEGIVLRDGPIDRWYEQALWVAGCGLERSYGIVFEGQEYEFHSKLRLRNQKRQVYADPEAQQPPVEAA